MDAPAKALPAWASYKPGTTTSAGEIIQEILQLGDKGAVFLNKQGELYWEYDECPNGLAAERLATGLIAQLEIAGLRRGALRRAQLLIATSLSSAFEDPDVTDCARHFENAAKFLLVRQTEALQTAYLISALGAGAVLSAASLLATAQLMGEVRDFAMAAGLGSVGAMLSVSQRFRSITIDRFSSKRFTITGGVSRVLFGGLFGAVFVLLQKSGLVLAQADSNVYVLATGALVAGFSERLIPELVGSVEGRILHKDPPTGETS